MNRLNKIVVSCLATAVMLLSSFNIPVMAENQQVGSSTSTADCVVTSIKPSTYTVSIPKTLSVTDQCEYQDCTKQYAHAHYAVKVSGDIGPYETIDVIPDESFVLSCDGRSDVSMSVNQNKTNWNSSDCESQATAVGLVKTSNESKLKAGDWTGSFSFTIKKIAPVAEEQLMVEARQQKLRDCIKMVS